MVRARWAARSAAVLVAAALLAAGCGDTGSSDTSGPAGSGAVNDGATTTAAPVSGGSLTMAMYSETRALDPVDANGSGTAGGTELTALYDTIMRWNPAKSDFEPRTAKALTANADFTEWTLELKPGITFRDGTPYDAEAVKFSIDRHKSPQNTVNSSRAHLAPVTSTTVTGPLTVKFTLSQPWAGFPYVLADEPGMLVSPTALKALGDPTDPGYKDKKAAFNLSPVGAGAGPFEIASFKPKEAIVMKKNANYWGGPVHLDELKFVVPGGADKSYDYLKADTVQAAFLRTPVTIDEAKAAKFPGYETVMQGGNLLLLNAAGGATKDAKVRQAVAAAIDPKTITDRVYNGKGNPGNALFQKSFAFDPGVPGPKVDQSLAKQYLAEAKAAGYDGKIKVLCTNQPERQATALTVQTMLQAAGFDVTTKSDLDTQAQIIEMGKKDFDIGCFGIAVSNDAGATLSLIQAFKSESPSNRGGYKSAAFDAALSTSLAANTPEQKTAAFKKLAELYDQDLPAIVLEAVTEYVAWSPKVHGIEVNQATMLYFDKAWIEH